jgi:hypothetical protein
MRTGALPPNPPGFIGFIRKDFDYFQQLLVDPKDLFDLD